MKRRIVRVLLSFVMLAFFLSSTGCKPRRGSDSSYWSVSDVFVDFAIGPAQSAYDYFDVYEEYGYYEVDYDYVDDYVEYDVIYEDTYWEEDDYFYYDDYGYDWKTKRGSKGV